jgi:TolB-like protein
MSLLAELKRRNVIRMAGLYLLGAWLIVQVAGTVLPWFAVSASFLRAVVIVLAIGFVPALVFAWVFELTPEGIKRDDEVDPTKSIAPQTARRMDRAIMVVLALALAYFGFDRFVLLPQRQHAMVNEATRAGVAQAKVEAKQEETGKSIAVLPFDNRSGDSSQDYYADGLTDELTTTLARISELKVIARTSAARFKGSDKAPSAIGRELGVAALVTGSVLRAGGRIRYTAELVSAVTEKTLWADSFERDEKDVLTLQSQVAQAITKAIEVRLSPTEATRLAGPHTVDPKAFDEYLRGRALWNQRTEGSVREALQHFQNAIRIAPDFALGYVGIADSNIILGVWGFESPGDVFPAAKKAAEHALELDPGAGEAHASLGDIYFHYYWDWSRSQHEHEQAMQLAPAFATAYQWDAEPLEIVGDYAGAIAKLRHAQELDPLSMVIRAQLGRVMARSGQRDQAIAELREAIALDPEFLRTRRELVRQLLAAKRNDEALLQARQLQALGSKDVSSLAILGLCLGRNGFPDEARAVLLQLDEASKLRFVSSLERARISAGLGEREATLKYLEKAVADREGNVPLLATDEEFEFLHGDPRYAAILHSIGVPKT